MTDQRVIEFDDLVHEARRGGDAEMCCLVEHAYPIVRRWSLVHTGDPADADDVTQDVLIRMVQSLHTFRSGARFETWLYALTRNASLDRLRAEGRRRKASETFGRESRIATARPADALDALQAAQVRGALIEALSELPDRQRAAFDLVELQGQRASEAAEIMGIRAVSVRAHLFKARRAMRTKILTRYPTLAEGALRDV